MERTDDAGGRAAVVVPVKSFAAAKARLAGVLGPDARARLARRMAEQVVTAAAPLPVIVVCDDDDVRSWALGMGADVAWCPGLGLDGAVGAGVARVADRGFDRVVVSHADLPLARALAPLAAGEGVTLVPDRHDDGTNVICLPAASGFVFRYGPGSFARHCDEAARLGLPVRIVRDPALGWDVDRPADLDHPAIAGVLGAADLS